MDEIKFFFSIQTFDFPENKMNYSTIGFSAVKGMKNYARFGK